MSKIDVWMVKAHCQRNERLKNVEDVLVDIVHILFTSAITRFVLKLGTDGCRLAHRPRCCLSPRSSRRRYYNCYSRTTERHAQHYVAARATAALQYRKRHMIVLYGLLLEIGFHDVSLWHMCNLT